MKQITRIAILIGTVALAACASQGSTHSAGADATQQGSPATASDDSQAIPSGYYRKVVDGAELFCRNDVNTGSHVARREVCITREQLKAQQLNNQRAVQELQGEGYTRH